MAVIARTDAEKIAHYDAMREQNRKHHVWHGELQARITELEAEAAATRGAVAALREVEELLVRATIELPSERQVTIERALAIVRDHVGGR